MKIMDMVHSTEDIVKTSRKRKAFLEMETPQGGSVTSAGATSSIQMTPI